MNAKPVFKWAKQNGETKIIDRILVRLLPELIKHDLQVTSGSICEMSELDVSDELFDKIKSMAEELVGMPYKEK